MAISNKQLQRFKKVQAIAKSHCERTGTKLVHPVNSELLEQYQDKQNVELDQQTMKDIQEQVKNQVQQAIDNGLKDLFK